MDTCKCRPFVQHHECEVHPSVLRARQRTCDAPLFNDGRCVAVCTRTHGIEHSHGDHAALEYVARGEARLLNEGEWRCDECGDEIDEVFTFPASGTFGARDDDPDGGYCECCYLNLRDRVAA